MAPTHRAAKTLLTHRRHHTAPHAPRQHTLRSQNLHPTGNLTHIPARQLPQPRPRVHSMGIHQRPQTITQPPTHTMDTQQILQQQCQLCQPKGQCPFRIRGLQCQHIDDIQTGIDLALQHINTSTKETHKKMTRQQFQQACDLGRQQDTLDYILLLFDKYPDQEPIIQIEQEKIMLPHSMRDTLHNFFIQTQKQIQQEIQQL